jgi:hypothetical protein
MKNKLSDLQNHLFEMMERLMEYDEEDLESEKLDRKIKIHMAFNEYAKTAVANGALMVKCVDVLYGIPVSDDVPLIPKTNNDTFLVDSRKKSLTKIPRDDGNGGYKRGKQQPV